MPKQKVNVDIESTVLAAAVSRSQAEHMSLDRLVEIALKAYLTLASSDAGNADQSPTALIASLVERVERLEQHQPAAERLGASGHGNPEQGDHPLANGGRWLTLSQALSVSNTRGGPVDAATLEDWIEAGKLESLGLRYCPHGTARYDLASFEDLWHDS